MLKKCEQLLEGLQEMLSLAQEIKAASGADNLDVLHIQNAINVVTLRIGYLKSQAQIKADAEKAEKAAAELLAKQKEAFTKLHADSTLEILHAAKKSAAQILEVKPDHADSLLQVEVLDKLIADKTPAAPAAPPTET